MESKITSPCVKKCCLDDTKVCVGCRRTLKEIRLWSKMTENERIIICNQLKERIKPQ